MFAGDFYGPPCTFTSKNALSELILRATACNASRVLAVVEMYVRPFVRLSVRHTLESY